MKRIFLLFITAASAVSAWCAEEAKTLIINELMQSNVENIMDDIKEFPDSWVELYNPTEEAINLKDYKIGTKDKVKKAWQLPDKTVPAKGYVVIYCDKEGKEDNRLHANFRLESGKDGNLYLFKGSDIVDKLEGMAKMPAPDVASTYQGKSSLRLHLTTTKSIYITDNRLCLKQTIRTRMVIASSWLTTRELLILRMKKVFASQTINCRMSSVNTLNWIISVGFLTQKS